MDNAFTREELNALGIIVNAAGITGKDAEFIVELKRKIAALLQEPQDVEVS